MMSEVRHEKMREEVSGTMVVISSGGLWQGRGTDNGQV